MKVDVLILAGARNNGSLEKYSSAEYEALIEIGKFPMIEYVIKAVKRAKFTGRTVIVGPRKQLQKAVNQEVDSILNQGSTMIENIQKGILELNSRNYMMIITSDIPLITADMIDEFILLSKQKQADIYYPIISKEHYQQKFPDVKRTYVHLKEGIYTGGNMIIMKPEILQQTRDLFKKVILWRKKPWKLSQLLGIKFIFKCILGNLTLSEIENRISQIIGYNGKAMIIDYPEVGFDIDKPSDLQLMRNKYFIS